MSDKCLFEQWLSENDEEREKASIALTKNRTHRQMWSARDDCHAKANQARARQLGLIKTFADAPHERRFDFLTFIECDREAEVAMEAARRIEVLHRDMFGTDIPKDPGV